ncbi:MAG: hypothetical protein NZM25_08125 [Leptospiraceae bacterium]|nr:hypothetical protein [Leptospiraceae bacterium]
MKYQILVTDNIEDDELEKELKKVPQALTIFYYRPRRSFFKLGIGGQGRIITPTWRRHVTGIADKLCEILDDLPYGASRAVRRSDFLAIFRALRNMHQKKVSLSRLFLLRDKVIFWEQGRKEKTVLLTEKKLDLWLWQELQQAEYNYIHPSKRKETMSVEACASLKDKLQLKRAPDIIFFEHFYAASSLVYLMGWNSKTMLCPINHAFSPGVRFWPKPDRVLVLTHLAGSPMPELTQNLEFWTKGILGYSFKHVYGILSKERLAPLFNENKRYDLIIYRGHSLIRNGRLALPQANFYLEKLPTRYYLHLSCTDYSKEKLLKVFAARYNILPIFRILDFGDKDFVEGLLSLWKKEPYAEALLSFFAKTPFLVVCR